MYLKAKWANKFVPETDARSFFNGTSDVKVDFLSTIHHFAHRDLEHSDAKILELEYTVKDCP
jgi:serine protease inhibitor